MQIRVSATSLAFILTLHGLGLAGTAAELAKEGAEAYRQQRFQEAARAYQEAVQKRPSPELFLNLGHCLLRLKKYPEAAEAYGSALKLDPSAKDGEWFLAQALFGAKRFDEAIPLLQKVSATKPEAFLVIGQCYEGLDDLISAETVYRQAAAQDPKNRILREALGVVYLRLHRYREAESVYRALCRRFPNDEKLVTRLAEARVAPLVESAADAYGSGQFERAAKYYEATVDILPAADYLVNLGHCYLHGEDYEKAIECYQGAVAKAPQKKDFRGYLGRALFWAGKYRDAIAALKGCTDGADRQSILVLIGQAYERLDDLKQAEKALLEAAGPDRKHKHGAQALAALYASTRRYDQAVEVYAQLCEHFPDDGDLRDQLSQLRAAAYAEKGNQAFSAGDLKTASTCFRASLKEQRVADVLVNLGHTHLGLQRYSEGVSAYRDALALDPKRQDVHWYLAQALYQAGKYEAAIPSLRTTIEYQARDQGYVLIGKAFEMLEDPVSAQAAYEQGLVQFPGSRGVREALAALHIAQGRPALGEKLYVALARKHPGDKRLLKNLAEVRLETGALDAALDTLELLCRVAPDDAAVLRSLADAYLSREMYREAAGAYRRLLALTKAPSSEDYFRLAHAYYQGGELVSATAALRDALKLDAHHAPSHLYLGHIRRREGDADSAIAAYENARRADPQLREARLALAGIYLERKQYQPAAEQYLGVLAMGVCAPAVYRDAVIALKNGNDREGARRVLREAFEHHPGHKDLAGLVELLGERQPGRD